MAARLGLALGLGGGGEETHASCQSARVAAPGTQSEAEAEAEAGAGGTLEEGLRAEGRGGGRAGRRWLEEACEGECVGKGRVPSEARVCVRKGSVRKGSPEAQGLLAGMEARRRRACLGGEPRAPWPRLGAERPASCP